SPSAILTPSQRWILLIAAAVSSACGLAIELLLGTLASYLVGNQALAFGVAVGGFLAAMGLGAYLTRFLVTGDEPQLLLIRFIQVELAIAPLSFLLPLALFALFVIDAPFWLALFLATILLGTLAGMEIPLLTRLLEKDEDLKDVLSGILALDYVGALVGSLAFPIFLLPLFGMFPTAAIVAAMPAGMVFILTLVFPRLKLWRFLGLALAIALLSLAPLVLPLSDRLENMLYQAPIVTRIQSPYQRIVVTRRGRDVRLFLDGDLQFSTLDEYRYHEALVHPALSAIASAQPEKRLHVLLMGAGDGLALREVLKWEAVERVVVLELDPEMVKLARSHPALVAVNQNALADRRVEVRVGDALIMAPRLAEQFDVVIADFPDPDRDIIAKLYSEGFYKRLRSRLTPDGIFVTQASSPFFAPQVIDCIATTVAAAELQPFPYVVDVPSFGLWGFVMGRSIPVSPTMLKLPIATRFLTESLLQNLFHLPADVQLGQAEVNRLTHPVIVKYQNDDRWATY
ncbi:MAG: polyamine aminopropyltransferase, partial [Synechococcales bacterium]|nr:polyamine aminopropyltransferase [Synechococcales bacterium]